MGELQVAKIDNPDALDLVVFEVLWVEKTVAAIDGCINYCNSFGPSGAIRTPGRPAALNAACRPSAGYYYFKRPGVLALFR